MTDHPIHRRTGNPLANLFDAYLIPMENREIRDAENAIIHELLQEETLGKRRVSFQGLIVSREHERLRLPMVPLHYTRYQLGVKQKDDRSEHILPVYRSFLKKPNKQFLDLVESGLELGFTGVIENREDQRIILLKYMWDPSDKLPEFSSRY